VPKGRDVLDCCSGVVTDKTCALSTYVSLFILPNNGSESSNCLLNNILYV
jgi:hypothetical protein